MLWKFHNFLRICGTSFCILQVNYRRYIYRLSYKTRYFCKLSDFTNNAFLGQTTHFKVGPQSQTPADRESSIFQSPSLAHLKSQPEKAFIHSLMESCSSLWAAFTASHLAQLEAMVTKVSKITVTSHNEAESMGLSLRHH